MYKIWRHECILVLLKIRHISPILGARCYKKLKSSYQDITTFYLVVFVYTIRSLILLRSVRTDLAETDTF